MSDIVKVSLGLIVDGFNVALKSAENQTESFSKRAVTNFQFIEKSFAVMTGNIAANAFEKVTSGIKDAFNNVINEAAESEAAVNNLNIALRNAGLYSTTSSDGLQTFAADLQKITIYGDEAILKSASLLLSLTNLDEQGVQKATKAAANLAATLGIELSEATDMIAKAINGNVTAFKKKGIAIQSADTDAGRLANTLAALATQEGAAEAATNSYTGAKAKQANQLGEVLEGLGKMVTQNGLVRASIESSTQAFADSAEWLQNNKKFVDDLTTTIAVTTGVVAASVAGYYAVSTALGIMAISAATGVGAFQALGIAAGVAWGIVTAPITLIIAGIAAVGFAIYQIVKHWDDVKASAYNALAATLEFAAKGAEVFSSSKAQALRNQAQAWRDKAVTIRQASEAVSENAKAEDAASTARDRKLKEEADANARIYANKAEARRIHAETLVSIDVGGNLVSQEAEVAHQEKLAEIRGESNVNTLTATFETQAELLSARQAHERDLLQLQIDADINKAKLEQDSKARSDALKAASDKAAIDREKLRVKQSIDTQKFEQEQEAALLKKKEQDRKDSFSTIATMANSNNKNLAAIGKAAGITQIAIDTPVAISKALAAFPPPFNFAAAALVGTAMAAQAANIAGVNFADGGIVPGSDMSGDRIRANVNSGEMFLNRRQQATLFEIANGRAQPAQASDNTATKVLIGLVQELVNQPISIQIDGKEIVNVLRSQNSSGRRLS